MRRYNDPTIMTAEFKSTPVTAALQREPLAASDRTHFYCMPPYCLSDGETTPLAVRTLDIVSCA